MRANLTATFLTARAFLREVERNGHGSQVVADEPELAGVVGVETVELKISRN